MDPSEVVKLRNFFYRWQRVARNVCGRPEYRNLTVNLGEAHGSTRSPTEAKKRLIRHRIRVFPGDTAFELRVAASDPPTYTGAPDVRGDQRKLEISQTSLESEYFWEIPRLRCGPVSDPDIYGRRGRSRNPGFPHTSTALSTNETSKAGI